MESYFIIKSILDKYTDLDNITFKDTRSYFGFCFKIIQENGFAECLSGKKKLI